MFSSNATANPGFNADSSTGPTKSELPKIAAALETALVRELVSAWKRVNQVYFKSALLLPIIELARVDSRLGLWRADVRVIEISRRLALTEPWGVVVEVLKHEMAHQYVHEVLRATDETAHGRAFKETCARLGVDAGASGLPSPSDKTDEREERVVGRIARLLALAESPNQHEAEAAMAAAQRLMLKYNIDVARDASERAFSHRCLGKPSGRVSESERILAMLLGKHFFVEVIWVPCYRPLEGKAGSILEICGTRANLAIAEYVHGFLMHTAAHLWEQHRRSKGIRSNRDRRVFLSGVMSGFAEKLSKQGAAHREEGLVWVQDGDAVAFFRKRHPFVRHVRHEGHRKNEAYAHGKEAGRNIVLRRGVNAAATSGGLLLARRAGD
jgi:hypothetical protein